MTDTMIRTIETRIHGRYLVRRTGTGERPALFVGFHGYGQSAEDMLEPLARLAGGRDAVLVPVQALHRFYNVKAQTVVACWMTQQDRELAIEDNVEYVSAVVDEVRREMRGDTGPLVFAGFSQGAPMAWRAALMSGHECSAVVALGGDLPPELTPEQLRTLPPVMIGRGASDEWFARSVFEENVRRLESAGCEVRGVEYEGGHEWAEAFVSVAREWLSSRL